MSTTDFIQEILRYTIPSLIVMIGMFLIVEAIFRNERKEKEAELQRRLDKEMNKIALPIQLQAYERLIMFLERINPQSSIHRVRKSGMTAKDIQLAMVRNIRDEFEHNMSQQLYVSPEAWSLVVTVKDELIKLLNLIGEKMPESASSMDFTKALFDYFISSEKEIPTNTAIRYLKHDAQRLLV